MKLFDKETQNVTKLVFLAIAFNLLIFTLIASLFFGIINIYANNIVGKTVKKTKKIIRNTENEIDRTVSQIMRQHRSMFAKGYRKGGVFIYGDLKLRKISLTFDDGPHQGYTENILDILRNNNIKATFFIVGKQADKYPDLVKKIYEAGHQIGNHTYNHVDLTELTSDEVAEEIIRCSQTIKTITGSFPHIYRPPGGNYDRLVVNTAADYGFKTILWTSNAADCTTISEKSLKRRVLRSVTNGGIILMHDGIDKTLEVLPDIIQQLKSEKYEFVTIDQLMISSKSKMGQDMQKIKTLPGLTVLTSENIAITKEMVFLKHTEERIIK